MTIDKTKDVLFTLDECVKETQKAKDGTDYIEAMWSVEKEIKRRFRIGILVGAGCVIVIWILISII